MYMYTFPVLPSILEHWLPDGVRTNIIFTEVPQTPYMFQCLFRMRAFCHTSPRRLTVGSCGTSAITPLVPTPSGSCRGKHCCPAVHRVYFLDPRAYQNPGSSN